MGIPARVVAITSGLLVLCAPLALAEDVTISYEVTYGERGAPIRHQVPIEQQPIQHRANRGEWDRW